MENSTCKAVMPQNSPRPEVSELSRESTFNASNTSKSDFLTWMRLFIVPIWLVTTGWKELG